MKTLKLRISTAIILMTICLIANLLNAQIIGNPTPIDDCCDLKYPARQIGVEGGDLLNHFIPVFATSINGKYKIHFTPTNTYKNISQAYINYVKALYPCATGMTSKIVISQGNLGGHT